MLSFVNACRVFISKLVAFLYSAISLFSAGTVGCGSQPAETPDDFTPVLRFAICSDVHLNGEEDQVEAKRLADLFNTSYNYAASCDYSNLDAVIVAGDFATSGLPIEYEMFKKVVNANIKDGTRLITVSGNHEYISYRDVDATVGEKVYLEEMGTAMDNHYVINGYHFISVSYCDDGKTFTEKKQWIKNEIEKAIEDCGDKPIFVIQHPAPFGTIYGSINWGDFDIAEVLSAYPQVIDFSGHSHYPINDPRSIWQGTFTALGCGTLSYFETELDCFAGNFPYQTDQAAQFYIVEADAEGNVLVKPYDLITHQFFDNEYYLTGLADKNYDYSYNKMKSRDSAPVFADDTAISTSLDEEGNTILKFDGATTNGFVVESYKLNLTRLGVTVYSDNFSGKYMYLFEDNTYTVNMGKLDSSKKYTVSIIAYSAYTKASQPLTYTFTAE